MTPSDNFILLRYIYLTLTAQPQLHAILDVLLDKNLRYESYFLYERMKFFCHAFQSQNFIFMQMNEPILSNQNYNNITDFKYDISYFNNRLF